MRWIPEAIYMALPLPGQNTTPDSGGRGLLIERPTILPRGLGPHTGMLLGVGGDVEPTRRQREYCCSLSSFLVFSLQAKLWM